MDREGARAHGRLDSAGDLSGQKSDTAEPLNGPTVTAMAELAGGIPCTSFARLTARTIAQLNTAVLLDRQGRIALALTRSTPTGPEFDVDPPVQPGSDVPVVETDFGRIGIAVCFDVNVPEIWKRLAIERLAGGLARRLLRGHVTDGSRARSPLLHRARPHSSATTWSSTSPGG